MKKTRNLETELDMLRNEVAELKKLLKPQSAHKSPPTQRDYSLHTAIHNALREDFEYDCKSRHPRIGTIATVGYFGTGDEEENFASWGSYTFDTEDLLSLIENRTAEKVLTCIGNNDRLNLLLSLLRKPNTTAGLVESGAYSSSGQVYHHLKPLIAADLVVEDKKNAVKGTYIVQPHRVQGIIILLEGIQNMVSTRFTEGDWDKANEA